MHKSPRLFLIAAAAIVIACRAYSQSSADKIINEIEALNEPAKPTDAQMQQLGTAMKLYFLYCQKLGEYAKKRDDLTIQLYEAAPRDSRTAHYLEWRWKSGLYEEIMAKDWTDAAADMSKAVMKVASDTKQVVGADIDRVLGDNPSPAIKEVAAVQKIGLVLATDENTNPIPLIDDFAKQYPKSPKTADLLFLASANMEGDARIAILKRIEASYPDYANISAVKAALRGSDDVGRAFELKFTDVAGGKTIDIAQLRGKVVLVDFWATWCGPCVAEMPEVKKIYSKYHDKGLEILGVSLDEPESEGGLKALKNFIAKNEIPWPQFYQGNGWDSKFSSSWGIQSIPTMFAVGKDGKLIGVVAPRSDGFEAKLQQMLAAG